MANDNQQNQPQQMQIKMTDEVLHGTYANGVSITHTPEEFVLDFMNIFPPAGIVNARVMMSPGHVKRFLDALSENVKKYEAQFGKITASEQPAHNIGFRTE